MDIDQKRLEELLGRLAEGLNVEVKTWINPALLPWSIKLLKTYSCYSGDIDSLCNRRIIGFRNYCSGKFRPAVRHNKKRHPATTLIRAAAREGGFARMTISMS